MPQVLVGVDGSPESLAAVDLAVMEAQAHQRSLRIVHAFVWPALGVYLGASPEGPPQGGLANEADRLLQEAVAHARQTAPDLAVQGEVIAGTPAPVLLGEAEQAHLLVLGSRGLGGFAGLLLGSVAVQVSAHSPRPVLVARGRQAPSGPVVVGVDGSPPSIAALHFAFAEAAVRNAELRVLNTWWGRLPAEIEEGLPLVFDEEQVWQSQAQWLSETVAPVAADWPGVVVHQEVRRARAAAALREASTRAQLVVAGARGRGGFAGLLLGSVSQALLHHADCPVAVVRG